MEKKVKIGSIDVIVKEMNYVDAVEVDSTKKRESAIKILKGSTNLTEDEINSLTVKEGLILQKLIDEVNGLKDFQIPVEEK